MKKTKASLPFILLLFFVLIVQFFNFLDAEQNSNILPWSRSMNLELEADNRTPFFRSGVNDVELFSAKNGAILFHTLKSDLSTEKQGEMKVPLSSQDPFWTNGDDVVYANNYKLYHMDNSGKINTLLEGVQHFKANEGLAVAVTDKELFSIDTETFEPVKISNLNGKAEDLILTLDTATFVTATQADASKLTFTLYQLNETKWSATKLFQYDTNLDMYSGLDYAVLGDTLHIIYTTQSRKGGGDLQIANFYSNISIPSLPSELTFTKLKVYDSTTNEQLPLIKNFNIVESGASVNLLFASTNEFNGRQAANIFAAKLHNERWEANRIGTTYLFSSKPIMVNEELITWLDFDASKDVYYVTGTSTNKEAVAKSMELTKEDYIHSLSRTIFSMSGAFIFLAVSFLVLLPPAAFLLGMNFFNIYNKTKFMWLAIASYFITQFYFIQGFFDSSSIAEGPFFINFSNSQFVLPIVTAGLAFLLYYLVRNRDWSEEVQVIYIVSLHMFMMVIMVGPFVF